MNLTDFTQTKAALLAAFLPLAKQHSRITATNEDLTIAIYLEAAIDSAEHYLDRDVWPTAREYTGTPELILSQYRFRFWRGRAESVKVMQGSTDITGQAMIEGSVDPRTWGFILTFGSNPGAIVVTFASGFATLDAMPSDLKSFILTAFGWLYEMRELANYTAMVQPANVIPEYLLLSWANSHFA
jgi:hypothetical protein